VLPTRVAKLFLVQHIKAGKIYQMATKYTKWPQNIPNGHKIYQMATKYTKWLQNIPNGHKIYQMATKYTKWPQNIPNYSKLLRMAIKNIKKTVGALLSGKIIWAAVLKQSDLAYPKWNCFSKCTKRRSVYLSSIVNRVSRLGECWTFAYFGKFLRIAYRRSPTFFGYLFIL
jgi:hypothetical protein